MRAGALMVLIVGVLAACVPGDKEPDTYTDKTGKTTIIESDQEMCTRSCNDDYTRCMETGPAEHGPKGMPSGMVGASADCRDELAKCLPACKSQ